MKNRAILTGLLLLFSLLVLSACDSNTSSNETAVPVTVQSPTQTENPPTLSTTESGYPSANGYPITTSETSAYPGNIVPTEEGMVSEPPNPNVEMPVPSEGTGSIGGVLIRQVTENGFLPLTPKALYLGEVLNNSEGEMALISFDEENSPQAQLLATGVFIFNNIPPGVYGLVIDVGFAQFPLTDEGGTQILITIEANQAIELGQIFVTLPE